MSNDLLIRYETLYTQLNKIIHTSESRVIHDDRDPLFEENVNFFVKSYLITICTYLEAYLQDLAFYHASLINDRLRQAKIPHNYIYWKTAGDTKEKDLSFKSADYACSKKEISDSISANPYKTIKTFKLLGIDLTKTPEIINSKELVDQIVRKRNNIIHHNDKATDISFSDISLYIGIFLKYIKSIHSTAQGQI